MRAELHNKGMEMATNGFQTVPEHGAHAVSSGRIHPLTIILGVLVLSLFPALFACPLYNPEAFLQQQNAQGGSGGSGGTAQGAPDNITLAATQTTLAWDPPTGGATIVSYTISYRVHGTTAWTTLATIAASSQPSYTVLRSATGPGSFDFAVVAVDSTGVTSPVHTSLDSTADPNSGWYLTW